MCSQLVAKPDRRQAHLEAVRQPGIFWSSWEPKPVGLMAVALTPSIGTISCLLISCGSQHADLFHPVTRGAGRGSFFFNHTRVSYSGGSFKTTDNSRRLSLCGDCVHTIF